MIANRVLTKTCLWNSILDFSHLCPPNSVTKSCHFYFLNSIHAGNTLVQAAVFFPLDYYNEVVTGFPSFSLATLQFYFLIAASHHLNTNLILLKPFKLPITFKKPKCLNMTSNALHDLVPLYLPSSVSRISVPRLCSPLMSGPSQLLPLSCPPPFNLANS